MTVYPRTTYGQASTCVLALVLLLGVPVKVAAQEHDPSGLPSCSLQAGSEDSALAYGSASLDEFADRLYSLAIGSTQKHYALIASSFPEALIPLGLNLSCNNNYKQLDFEKPDPALTLVRQNRFLSKHLLHVIRAKPLLEDLQATQDKAKEIQEKLKAVESPSQKKQIIEGIRRNQKSNDAFEAIGIFNQYFHDLESQLQELHFRIQVLQATVATMTSQAPLLFDQFHWLTDGYAFPTIKVTLSPFAQSLFSEFEAFSGTQSTPPGKILKEALEETLKSPEENAEARAQLIILRALEDALFRKLVVSVSNSAVKQYLTQVSDLHENLCSRTDTASRSELAHYPALALAALKESPQSESAYCMIHNQVKPKKILSRVSTISGTVLSLTGIVFTAAGVSAAAGVPLMALGGFLMTGGQAIDTHETFQRHQLFQGFHYLEELSDQAEWEKSLRKLRWDSAMLTLQVVFSATDAAAGMKLVKSFGGVSATLKAAGQAPAQLKNAGISIARGAQKIPQQLKKTLIRIKNMGTKSTAPIPSLAKRLGVKSFDDLAAHMVVQEVETIPLTSELYDLIRARDELRYVKDEDGILYVVKELQPQPNKIQWIKSSNLPELPPFAAHEVGTLRLNPKTRALEKTVEYELEASQQLLSRGKNTVRSSEFATDSSRFFNCMEIRAAHARGDGLFSSRLVSDNGIAFAVIGMNEMRGANQFQDWDSTSILVADFITRNIGISFGASVTKLLDGKRPDLLSEIGVRNLMSHAFTTAQNPVYQALMPAKTPGGSSSDDVRVFDIFWGTGRNLSINPIFDRLMRDNLGSFLLKSCLKGNDFLVKVSPTAIRILERGTSYWAYFGLRETYLEHK